MFVTKQASVIDPSFVTLYENTADHTGPVPGLCGFHVSIRFSSGFQVFSEHISLPAFTLVNIFASVVPL